MQDDDVKHATITGAVAAMVQGLPGMSCRNCRASSRAPQQAAVCNFNPHGTVANPSTQYIGSVTRRIGRAIVQSVLCPESVHVKRLSHARKENDCK